MVHEAKRSFVPYGVMGACLFALVVRGTMLLLCFDNLTADPDSYALIARNVADHGEFSLGGGRPTAFRPPLYPLLLAPFATRTGVARAAVAAVHLLLGLLTIGLTAVLARRWLSSSAAAYFAAFWVALDPILLHQSTLVMTETCATALAALSLGAIDAWWQRPSAKASAWIGAGLALSVLCRPTFVVWVPFVLAWMMVAPNAVRRSRLRSIMMTITVFLVVMSPWWLRNWRQFGQPIWTTTHGGYTLWLANNDDFYDHLAGIDRHETHRHGTWSSSRLDRAQQRLERSLDYDEVAVDRAEARLAWSTMGRRPAMAVASGIYRLFQFWNPLPRAVEGRLSAWPVRGAIAVWYVCQFALAAWAVIGLTRRGKWTRWFPALALCLALSAVHAVYWSNPRMRAPLAPCLAIAAAGVVPGIARGRGRARGLPL